LINSLRKTEIIGVVEPLRSGLILLSNFAGKQESFFMNTHPDFEELLRLLEEHHVKYMIIG